MLTPKSPQQYEFETVYINELVPEDHLVRLSTMAIRFMLIDKNACLETYKLRRDKERTAGEAFAEDVLISAIDIITDQSRFD